MLPARGALHRLVIAAVIAASTLAGSPVTAGASSDRTTLDVAGETAITIRDGFGVPHIFARTNRALFEAYGYAVAQDRLWQLELNRRAARGRLSELFGRSTLSADTVVRTVGYTNDELDAQFAILGPEEQEIFRAYRDGINRFLREARLDPRKLPFEFHALGVGPADWELRDSAAFGAFMTRRFGEIGGRHLTNQALLASLVQRFGPQVGQGVFDDVRWVNDPDSPVTVPPGDEVDNRHQATRGEKESLQPDAATADELFAREEMEAKATWERLGVATKLGSYAWVVSPKKSTNHSAMLFGGPQMGFSAPEVLHEVQLTGGNGFNVMGMAFAGVPPVLIGRTDRHAWTSTTATGGNVDTYVETLCAGGSGTLFKGECVPMERRSETIAVRGELPVALTISRSVHGPIVGALGGVAFSQKRAHWKREIESVRPFLTFDRAGSLAEFEAAAKQVVTSHNFLYADQDGNIAYWQAGQVPIRPAGFDYRLPFPGDGRAEWPGGILPMPTSINPKQGFLANWNNKPSVDYDNADSQIFGKQFRLLDLQDRLAKGRVSLDDMRDIPKDIARFGGLGREARFLMPYLMEALDEARPAHPLAGQVKQILEEWDGNVIVDAVTSTRNQPGEVIFSNWLRQMITNTFSPALGNMVGEASSNMLLHVLDDRLGDGSGVPPSRDYFEGADPQRAITAALDEVLAQLETSRGPDPSQWTDARPVTEFRHPVVGVVGRIPTSNRATYAQIVVLSRPVISENIFTLGQSGFIRLVPPRGFALDDHFRDQLDLYRNFEFKPMRLLRPPDD